ncbi:MAG TPA: hypothetical protein VFZ43_06445 [Anaerolineales bacterium]
MVETIKLEWLKAELINILRWEDDGGKVIEINHSTLDQTRRKNPMNKRVGLWLDRRKAVIVSIANNIEGRRIITSDMEHYVLYSTIVPGDGSPENIRDRRFWNHLGEYYDKIIAHIRDATEIQIFGPEVAKYELQQRLENEGLAGHIVSLEDADKLTDLQIATRVQKRFPTRSRFDLSNS